MRLTVLGCVFMLAAVPATQAQQTRVPASTQQSDPRPVEVPTGVTVAETTPASTETIRAGHAAAEREAIQEPSAKTILAIIGAIVVVVALIALLR